MLWQKESKRGNAEYIDLFKSSSNVERQYSVTDWSRKMQRFDGAFYKNRPTAIKFRKEGNKLFKSNRIADAVECYNKSLCFAENGSKSVGLAYAMRSRCFMNLKMFKKCLADIELAKQNKNPSDLQLGDLQIKCSKLMESEEDKGEICEQKLDFVPNGEFPCLADVVDIRCNEEFGRHLVATDDIEAGKTIIVEQCYIGVTKNDHYKLCNICLKENTNLIPCEKCPTALFCFDCKENNLHEIECDMSLGCRPGFKFMDVVRSVSLAKNAFANADELIAFVEDLLKNNALGLPSGLVDERSKYRLFFNSSDWKSYPLNLEQAYLFYRLLLEQETMKEFFHTAAHKRFLMHLVQHHISMILQGSYNKRIFPIGGVFITDTYINIIARYLTRSYEKNVRLEFRNGYIVCITIQPIKKNELLMVKKNEI